MRKVLVSFLLMSILILTGCQTTPKMAGVTVESRPICLWDDPDFGFTDIDNAYVILINIRNGDMYDADATTPTVTTTYADAAIALTKDAQNTEMACGTLPVMDSMIDYGMAVCENATPTLGDQFKAFPLIDPTTGKTYVDILPILGNNVKVKLGY